MGYRRGAVRMSQADMLLGLLEKAPRCGQEMEEWGVGYRYSARIGELRGRGLVIEKQVCRAHRHRSRMYLYTLKERAG